MAKRQSKELVEALADQVWWKQIGTALHLQLVGWSYRHSAHFMSKDGQENSIQIPGWFARSILKRLQE